MKEIEIWKDVIGYEGLYQVSNIGRVKTLAKIRTGLEYRTKKTTYRQYKEKLMSQCIMRTYYAVVLRKDGAYKTHLVHRLVAKAFIQNPENKPNVNHIDFNPLNNHLSNLEWCTQYENIHHTIRHGRSRTPQGIDNGMAKIDVKNLGIIRSMIRDGIPNCEICKIFNVHSSTISNIKRNKTYRAINA